MTGPHPASRNQDRRFAIDGNTLEVVERLQVELSIAVARYAQSKTANFITQNPARRCLFEQNTSARHLYQDPSRRFL
jgi:hypothetical protein